MKQAETRDYFRTTIDQVGQEQLGLLSVLLAKAGFTEVRHELVTDVLRYKQKQSHDVKAEDFLIDWIADHKEFRAIEAVEHFRQAGRTDGSCYTALRVLVERKLLRKLGGGRYTLMAPKKAKVVKETRLAKQAKKARKQHDVSAPDFALRTMSKNHGTITSITLKRHFENDGRATTGVGPVLNKLLQQKKIKRTGEGQYALAKKPVIKGNGSIIPEVVANG